MLSKLLLLLLLFVLMLASDAQIFGVLLIINYHVFNELNFDWA